MVSMMDVDATNEICDNRPMLPHSAVSQRSVEIQIQPRSPTSKMAPPFVSKQETPAIVQIPLKPINSTTSNNSIEIDNTNTTTTITTVVLADEKKRSLKLDLKASSSMDDEDGIGSGGGGIGSADNNSGSSQQSENENGSAKQHQLRHESASSHGSNGIGGRSGVDNNPIHGGHNDDVGVNDEKDDEDDENAKNNNEIRSPMSPRSPSGNQGELTRFFYTFDLIFFSFMLLNEENLFWNEIQKRVQDFLFDFHKFQ